MSTTLTHAQSDLRSINSVLDTVTSIIEQKGIPCLSLSSEGLLQARPASPHVSTSGLDFVAISHVRSQGPHLGEATLFECLQDIQHLVRQLSLPNAAKLGFWIDILCVPENDCKTLARSMIPTVFQAASAVIAIDQSWTNKSVESVEDAWALIRSSMWLQRLWTIQEAALGRRVYFAFANRLLSLDDTNEYMDKRYTTSIFGEDHLGSFDYIRQFEDHTVEIKLRRLEQFQSDLTSLFSRAPVNLGVTQLKLNKFGFRWLLRLGYLSIPRFRWLVDQQQYNIAQEIMLQINTIYDNADKTLAPEQLLSAIDRVELAWEIVPEDGLNVSLVKP